VLEELHLDLEENEAEIGFEVRKDIVTLTGIVPSWEEHEDVARSAWSVSGTRIVDNKLALEKEPGGIWT
jgi:osmotically-inducible protein OsmY